jgi:hypothetical protein
MAPVRKRLKLIALDAEDLAVVSAQLQDAVVKVGDLSYQPGLRRFLAVLNRFDWLGAVAADRQPGTTYERRQCVLRFERVDKAQMQQLQLDAKNDVLELLAVAFTETDAPSGYVTLVFAGGGAIRLEVECLEAELKDIGPAWRTKSLPQHRLADGDSEPPAPGARKA